MALKPMLPTLEDGESLELLDFSIPLVVAALSQIQFLEIPMDHTHSHHSQQTAAPPFWRSRYAIGFLVFGAIAAYFLLSEHRAHFIGALPFLLLLACPLMHIFMHHGHGKHGRNDKSHGDAEQGSQKSSVQQANDAGERP